MMNNYFNNIDIILRPLEPEDLEVLYNWENDSTIWQFGSSVNPYSRFALRNYIADSQLDIFHTKQLRLMIVEKKSNTPVGTLDLYDFDALSRRAGIGILIDKDFRQRGYGSQSLQCIEKYAFNHLGLVQLYAFIPESNHPSFHLFAKQDYESTAQLKNWLRVNDGYVDVIVMQKIKKVSQ